MRANRFRHWAVGGRDAIARRMCRAGFVFFLALLSICSTLLRAAPAALEHHSPDPDRAARSSSSSQSWIPKDGATHVHARAVETPALRAMFDGSGRYEVISKRTSLQVEGNLPEAITHLAVFSGADRLGRFRQIDAVYGSRSRVAVIRLYQQSSTVLFLDRHKSADANANPFPEIDGMPKTMMRASYRVYKFSPIDFGKLDSQGPWLFFDLQRRTAVLSPADNFLVADMEELTGGHLASGIAPQIATLPSGFTHRTLLAFGSGINRTISDWGAALQKLEGKSPVANDEDIVLNKFGYWTDNGARYYYKFDPELGYEGTLLAIRKEFQKQAIPLAYMQLDSWWYPKQDPPGKGDTGTMIYRADPKIFPDGLEAFDRQLGLPLVTHGRWIAQKSPYRKQFQMSANVIIDPEFWNGTAEYLKRGGVMVYEQDWLNKNARPAVDIAQAHAYLSSMANGMMRKGIGIQYCMPLPAYFLASTQFANVRTIRTGDDHFIRARYDTFLYTSALARAVGLWPWSDVFMSGETLNLVLSTLSSGPVGTGDALGAIDAENLRRAMRADGVILKPDTSLMPVDSMYIEDAATGLERASAPMVAMARTEFKDTTENYLLSYTRAGNDAEAEVSLDSLGITGPIYVWDWVSQKGRKIDGGGSVDVHYQDGWGYQVIARVTPSGIALLGDTSKIVPLARKRFTAVSVARGVHATLAFSRGEKSVTITAYAEHDPHAVALEGTVRKLNYDAAAHLATFAVMPGPQSRARIRIW